MLPRVWLLILTMMMVKIKAASAEVIPVTASDGDSVLLTSGLNGTTEIGGDFRWTHPHLLLNKKITRCHHGRCEVQNNGSLRFTQVQVQDSGNYTLEVFNEAGNIQERKTYLLQVKDKTTSAGSHVGVSLLIPCFLLLFLLLVSIFILMRRNRMRPTMTSGQKEENVYVVMHGHRGNKGKQEEEERKEEELHYVPYSPAASEEQEDIYV